MPKDLAVQINDAIALLGKAEASINVHFLGQERMIESILTMILSVGSMGFWWVLRVWARPVWLTVYHMCWGCRATLCNSRPIGCCQIFYALTCLNSRKTAPVSFAF